MPLPPPKLAFICNLLFGANDTTQQQGSYLPTLIIIAISIVFFYFILWRPEQKRRKAGEAMRSSLKKGDRVTAMGIIGTVFQVKDNTIVVKMYDGAKVEFLKGAITDVQPGSGEGKEIEPPSSGEGNE